jgi:hypothetical protein
MRVTHWGWWAAKLFLNMHDCAIIVAVGVAVWQ